MMTTNECMTYDTMVEMGIATADELNLARCLVSGTWTEVLSAVCRARTGYSSVWAMLEAEDEDDE